MADNTAPAADVIASLPTASPPAPPAPAEDSPPRRRGRPPGSASTARAPRVAAPADIDPELGAMIVTFNALSPLGTAGRERVLAYLFERFGAGVDATHTDTKDAENATAPSADPSPDQQRAPDPGTLAAEALLVALEEHAVSLADLSPDMQSALHTLVASGQAAWVAGSGQTVAALTAAGARALAHLRSAAPTPVPTVTTTTTAPVAVNPFAS